MSFHIVQGDLEPDLDFQLKVNGEAVDLSAAVSYSMTVKYPDGTVVSGVEILALDLSTGMFRRTWDAGDTDQVGIHEATVQVVWADDEVQTFPSNGRHIRWHVDPPLA
jgi:hypothetical protein